MKTFLSFAIGFSFIFSSPCHAQTPTPTPAPSAGIDATFALGQWNQDLKYRGRVDGFIALSADRCLKLKARVSTGKTFNNEWNNTGLGIAQTQIDVSFRQIYVDWDCLIRNGHIEIGSMPTRSFGTMGCSPNGSLQGVQLLIPTKNGKYEWMTHGGQIRREADLIRQGPITFNAASVQFRRKPGTAQIAPYISFSYFDGQFYTRIGTETGTQKNKFHFNFEALQIDQHLIGAMIAMSTEFKKTNFRITASDLTPDVNTQERLGLQLKQFYGFGSNLLFEAAHPVQKGVWNLRFRVGEAGPLVQGGFAYRIQKVKKTFPVNSTPLPQLQFFEN